MATTLFLTAQCAKPEPQQPGFAFPQPLAEKYRPRRIADFVSLEKVKKVMGRFAARPFPSAWLFVGTPGLGKTAMALALAEKLSAEVHHIPSQQCNVANVENAIRQCWYVPAGGFHLVLVDEADQMSMAAQLAFLSKLDATAFPPATVFIFTCNSTERLEKRFLSRCHVLEFSSYGLNGAGAEFLGRYLAPDGAKQGNGAKSLLQSAQKPVCWPRRNCLILQCPDKANRTAQNQMFLLRSQARKAEMAFAVPRKKPLWHPWNHFSR